MASQGYRDWVTARRPYTLIRPAAAVQATLRGHGLTVYDYPNEAHLQAGTPEDHTPFSVTGWPGPNRRWKARGLDVMPRAGVPAAAARAENAAIARQLIRDRDAGHPGAMWIKYLNWTDETGVCRQERWMDNGAPLLRRTRSSSDKGHIHISGRSDVDDDDRADGYDPIARMNGGGDDVNLNDKITIPLYEALDGVGLPETETRTVGELLAGAYRRSYVAMHLADQIRDEARAAAVADTQRDQAALAAINWLVAAVRAGGGDLNEAALIAEVRAVGDQAHADMLLLQQLLAAERSRTQQLAAALAAAGASLQTADDPAA